MCFGGRPCRAHVLSNCQYRHELRDGARLISTLLISPALDLGAVVP